MLDRDPVKRLGSGPDDANELVQHPFFAGFDWDSLIAKKTVADFLPEIEQEHQKFYDNLEENEKLIGSKLDKSQTIKEVEKEDEISIGGTNLINANKGQFKDF